MADEERPYCPKCKRPLKRQTSIIMTPPCPRILWYCSNVDCQDGKANIVYYGG
jgi:hypothetical protein